MVSTVDQQLSGNNWDEQSGLDNILQKGKKLNVANCMAYVNNA